MLALGITAVNIGEVPEAISLIVCSAFGQEPMLAGMAGAAVAWGVRRAPDEVPARRGWLP